MQDRDIIISLVIVITRSYVDITHGCCATMTSPTQTETPAGSVQSKIPFWSRTEVYRRFHLDIRPLTDIRLGRLLPLCANSALTLRSRLILLKKVSIFFIFYPGILLAKLALKFELCAVARTYHTIQVCFFYTCYLHDYERWVYAIMYTPRYTVLANIVKIILVF